MVESYLITFREGVEIALIIGILIVYLKRIQKTHLIRTVFYALGTALFVSVVVAVVLEMLAMDFELLEGYLMFVAGAFVTTMILWMWKTAKSIKKEIEHKIDTLVVESKSSFAMYLGVFFFAFLMVVREGVETVIFLRAISSGQGVLGVLTGVTAGILAAVAFGIFFVKGSVRVDIGKFLKVTAVVLLIFVAQLLINGVHEFYELGVFPPNPEAMAIVGPIVRNNLLFVLAIFSIPAIMFIIPPSKKTQVPVSAVQRRWQLATGAATLLVVFFFGFDYVFANRSSVKITMPVEVAPANGVIRIPVTDLLDGELHRFVWIDPDSTHVRFFAIRTENNSFRTAFDACRACYNYGFYYMREGELICSVCDAPTELTNLAVATEGENDQSGSMEGLGCAPLYLPSQVKDGSILVSVENLEQRKKYFQTSFDYRKFTPEIQTGDSRRSHH